MTKNAIIVLCTCAGREEAAQIGRKLVEDRLAACVNILPELDSIYRWQGAVESARETLLLIKTTQSRFAEVRDRIAALHSYQVPEIVAISITAGDGNYLKWLLDAVRETPESPSP